MNRIYLALTVTALLAACGNDRAADSQADAEAGTVAAADTLDPAAGIDWFEGSVDEAFAAAKESGKPIYLYWGAVWCPPCHAISATVFKSPDFLERSKLFIPVYLDGDTENAQALGEKFGVRGYPTMIVFDSDGTELTRIPGGIDLQAYANILDLTLGAASPASQLVASLGDGPLTADECTLLAYYSWGQDTSILSERDTGAAFRQMYDACPVELQTERSILYFAWLEKAVEAAGAEENPVPLDDEQRAEALDRIDMLLADDQLVKANIFTTLLGGPALTSAITDSGSVERAELIAKFEAALDRIAADESIYKRERIYTLAGRIRFERIDDDEAEISESLRQRIRDMVVWADESTPGVYERQPIINALANVLDEAGMDDVAKPLLLAELEKSRQPYYFMVDLADIEQRAGNYDVAIGWLKKAYDSTKGPATRFQWGYYYLTGLLEMTPDDSQAIHDTTVQLISELQNSGGLYHRPKAQLGRLESNLLAWSEENSQAGSLAAIRASIRDVCAAAKHQGESRITCDAFLEQA